MESIWKEEVRFRKRERLSGQHKADVVVVGGGLAGILTAYLLHEKGAHVIVLEADRIGSGQSGNTTAKITMQHGDIYHKLKKKYGSDRAKGYAKANERAIWDYKQLIRQEHIDCDFKESDAYIYTTDDQGKLEREQQALEELGIPCQYTTRTTLPFPVTGALKMEHQAHFHPLKFLQYIATPLEIYEQSRVLSVESGRVLTAAGSVQAEHIVLATHYPFLITPGYYFTKLHQERSYVTALRQTQGVDGMYLGIDQDSYSFRMYQDYLLLGGAGHRTGTKGRQQSFAILAEAAKAWYPDHQITHQWAAQDCMPAGDVPFIGTFSKKMTSVYVMTGFQKWGMSTAMTGARIISEKILTGASVYGDLFAPSRSGIGAQMGQMMTDGGYTFQGYLKRVQDKPVCTHLGCALEWNEEEQSWDCPCHGSRFEKSGRVIDNPALRRLS